MAAFYCQNSCSPVWDELYLSTAPQKTFALLAVFVNVFVGTACSDVLLYLRSFLSAFPEQLLVHSV